MAEGSIALYEGKRGRGLVEQTAAMTSIGPSPWSP